MWSSVLAHAAACAWLEACPETNANNILPLHVRNAGFLVLSWLTKTERLFCTWCGLPAAFCPGPAGPCINTHGTCGRLQIFEHVQHDLKKFMGIDSKRQHLPLPQHLLKVRVLLAMHWSNSSMLYPQPHFASLVFQVQTSHASHTTHIPWLHVPLF